MIGLFTGLPGAGKTLWALTWINEKAKREGRQVFYSGIAELTLPWTQIEPEKWMDCPPNSIIVIDEAQRLFRTRSVGSNVPPYVAELETHRHKGVDVFLITQHPMLIDNHVRRLTGLHMHVVRKFGMQASTIHEWPSVKENCDKNRDDSTKHAFKYPKEMFGVYKSAEVHTHKRRIPMRFWIICSVPVILALVGWRIYDRVEAYAKPADTRSTLVRQGGDDLVPGLGGSRHSDKLTASQYVAQHLPRVRGLDYTAPVYDEVTKPQQAPYPAACVKMGKRCGCYSQQGTVLQVPEDLCVSIVAGGFFVAWDKPVQHAVALDARQAASAPLPAVPVLGGHVSLGGSPRAHILQDQSGASDQYGASGGTGGAYPRSGRNESPRAPS